MKWLHAARARLRLLFGRTGAEARMEEEFRFHVEMEANRLARARGLDPREARRQALVAFGAVESHKEALRDGRGLAWLGGWSLDLKLGTRMLVRSPGLTVVAVLALSVAIGAGAAYLEFVHDLVRPTLSFPGGNRLVGIVTWNARTGAVETQVGHEFLQWRGALPAFEQFGAHQPFDRNLITADGRSEPANGVEISASAFRVVPAIPLLGRPLTDADEQAGAPPVVVLGYDLWRARFQGDPAVIGRTVWLGGAPHTVVGVMDEGFSFPSTQQLWVPLRLAPGLAAGDGPPLRMFGRLAPEASIEAAQAQLTAVGERTAAANPTAPRQVRPVVKPYVEAIWATIADRSSQVAILYAANVFFLGLLGICGANVATLVFARTATREGELTVRTALGASRGRIVAQLFAEALVLTVIAAALGLLVASLGVQWAADAFASAQGTTLPFWWNDRLGLATVLYAVVLAVLAAGIIGVVPGLKATGPGMQAGLRQAAANVSGPRLGGVWTSMIVAQVALTVLFLMSVVSMGWNVYASQYTPPQTSYAPAEYVTARIEVDRTYGVDPEAFRAGVTDAYRNVERRLESAPGVVGVTHASHLPGMKQGEFFVEFQQPVELTSAARDASPLWVRTTEVAPDFFATFGAVLVAGRGFTAADANQRVAVVDQTFVDTVLGGRNPIGLRVRQPENGDNPSVGPWYEIVGVVADLTKAQGKTTEQAMLYRPALPGDAASVLLVVRGRSEPEALMRVLRAEAAAADSALRLYDVRPLGDIDRADREAGGFFVRLLAIIAGVALLLSTAGVYALMSFTLSRRTREIGIRAALGAAPRRIVGAIFSRAFRQVGLGVVAGSVPGAFLVGMGAPEVASGGGATVALLAVTAVGGFILVIAVLACVVPARRALRIQPTEALRAL